MAAALQEICQHEQWSSNIHLSMELGRAWTEDLDQINAMEFPSDAPVLAKHERLVALPQQRDQLKEVYEIHSTFNDAAFPSSLYSPDIVRTSLMRAHWKFSLRISRLCSRIIGKNSGPADYMS